MSDRKLINSTCSSSSNKRSNRSKKLPPPLCLPISQFTPSTEQRNSPSAIHSCCSSSQLCSHPTIPYVLPIHQRSEILQHLTTNSSSSLFTSSLSDTKQKKWQSRRYSKQREASQVVPIDNEKQWIDCIRLIISNSLQNEIKVLLEKYQTTYFDRVNASNTPEGIIRSNLCEMVSQILSSYSSSSSTRTDDNTKDSLSGIQTSNNNRKRKRENTDTDPYQWYSSLINDRSKFVISSIIPGKDTETTNSYRSISSQRYRQFQKKYTHLFHYVPDHEVQSYLIDQGYFQINPHLSNNQMCLMLYDEIVTYMDEEDLQISGISIDQSFSLPKSILERINWSSH